jgi:hypothetical protein
MPDDVNTNDQDAAINDSSADFGTVPNDSEPFGKLPNRSERKENHILTVHSTARKFEDAGVPRTERSITNWCQPDKNNVSRLDCYFDPNERKYYITPQSVERAIEEEKSKSKSGELPHASEIFGTVPNPSEAFRTIPHASESKASEQSTNQQNQQTNLSPDLAQELEELRIEKRVWERERKFYDTWFASVEKQNASFLPQIAELSKSVGYLEAKTESLEKENQRLLTTPAQNTQRFIEQTPHIDDESTDDIPEGERADIVTD